MYVASRMSTTTLEQWWFAVHVAVSGAGVTALTQIPSKSSSVNVSIAIDLIVTEGMSTAISNACEYV